MKPRPDRNFRRLAHLGLLLLSSALACRGAEVREQAGDGAALQRDSAGIVIVETPGATARAPLGWTVGAAPDLQIGSVTGEPPYQFHTIGGIAGGITQLPDGRILVVDAGSGELRFFDGEGGFLYKVGGLGDGPGEFRRPQLVPYPSSDSLLVFDGTLRRYTLLSSDGQSHRSFPPGGLPRDQVTGAARGGSPGGILMVMGIGVLTMGQVGQQVRETGVRWIDLTTARVDTVARFESVTFGTSELADMHYILQVPFTTSAAVAMSPEGFFATGGRSTEILGFDGSGRLARILRLAEPPRPVSAQDVQAVIDFYSAPFSERAAQARRVYEQMEYPSHWPLFESLRVDRLGWLWARLYHPRVDETPRWMVFDPDGVARGMMELPRDLDVHDIGADYILGHWRDDLRVEYVRRYRLERGPLSALDGLTH